LSAPYSQGKILGNRNGKVIANMPLDNASMLYSDVKPLPLTPRERQVLQELALGKSNKMIANILSISMYTVDGYVKDIYRKLGIKNRAMATLVAIQHGILNLNHLDMADFSQNNAATQ
jgi:DNA-binding NarL/FixJ family response regulator